MDRSTATETALATARLQWQLGDWDALAAIEPGAPRSGERAQDRIALLDYLVQGALQTARVDLAREALHALRLAGADRSMLLRSLFSSALNSLGRGWLAAGEIEKAERCVRRSVGLYPGRGEESLVARMRFDQQAHALFLAGLPTRHFSHDRKDRRLFIDCGGYDGCSVLKFLTTEPHYDCVSFEPNPELWDYYEDIPTQLIRKAVYTFDGEIDLTIDPVDGDGSSIHPTKQIDFTQQVDNKDCPVVRVPCVDLSAFVRNAAKTYGTIVLKLDIEGAEYDILEKMLEEGTIAHIDRIKCEFHGHKMDLDRARHERIVAQLEKLCPLEPWDALAFSVKWSDSKEVHNLRRALISAVSHNRASFLPMRDIGTL